MGSHLGKCCICMDGHNLEIESIWCLALNAEITFRPGSHRILQLWVAQFVWRVQYISYNQSIVANQVLSPGLNFSPRFFFSFWATCKCSVWSVSQWKWQVITCIQSANCRSPTITLSPLHNGWVDGVYLICGLVLSTSVCMKKAHPVLFQFSWSTEHFSPGFDRDDLMSIRSQQARAMVDMIRICISERRDLNQLNDKGASFVSYVLEVGCLCHISQCAHFLICYFETEIILSALANICQHFTSLCVSVHWASGWNTGFHCFNLISRLVYSQH